MYFIPAIISLQYPLFVFKWAINPISDWLSLCYCLKIQYKEDLGRGTALSDTPEMERVKRNQQHISTVHSIIMWSTSLPSIYHPYTPVCPAPVIQGPVELQPLFNSPVQPFPISPHLKTVICERYPIKQSFVTISSNLSCSHNTNVARSS